METPQQPPVSRELNDASQHRIDDAEGIDSRYDETGHTHSSISREEAARAIDDLFREALRKRGNEFFPELFRLLERCRNYSVFNLGLAYLQRPGAAAIATKKRWGELDRKVKTDAIPIIILRPFGPVMTVFEVSDTEGQPLRGDEIFDPFSTSGELVAVRLENLVNNAKAKDEIETRFVSLGYLLAGDVRPAHLSVGGITFWPESNADEEPSYRVRVSESLDTAARFAVLAHELAHVYCGHLGAHGRVWWPDRVHALSHGQREFEAEAAAHIVLLRQGLRKKSAEYLSRLISESDLEAISLDAILQAANRIEGHAKKAPILNAGER
ncbi:MAG: ImmA/IrrE family metallo-endopeptidase [Rhodospirillaceae bacterium]|jgi:hypothetical protein|nr:ImmA/IrrE family metallo-endopeptidase [Rhodospirillaceae bacterium]MBT6311366.1 ImmA/IrrE family metallo-endopeptidase [Rhodospirillaceae bacterium]